MGERSLFDFDGFALFHALDEARQTRGLSWQGVADEIWSLSAELNDRRKDHPIAPSTIQNLGKRGGTTCQHALFFLRWLGRSPESFLTGAPVEARKGSLPPVGPDRRLRWNLKQLHAALDTQRRGRGLTWAQLAEILRCTPSQLTGLRTARFATGMNIAMRSVQWLERPAADFIYLAKW
ncbi:MAG: hypothetical protein J2P57_02015 [Acidimicrobiaceae bacterium]|nr:hypothetical protein [Acidimicrobiaceae bacterium]